MEGERQNPLLKIYTKTYLGSAELSENAAAALGASRHTESLRESSSQPTGYRGVRLSRTKQGSGLSLEAEVMGQGRWACPGSMAKEPGLCWCYSGLPWWLSW